MMSWENSFPELFLSKLIHSMFYTMLPELLLFNQLKIKRLIIVFFDSYSIAGNTSFMLYVK